jgi:hypothetical protein
VPPVTNSLHLVRSLADTLGSAPDAGLATDPGLATDAGPASGPAAGTDPLATRDSAADWLHEAGLLPADAGLSGSEHSALLRLREALRDVLAARAAGRPDPDAAARLTKGLADGRLVVTLTVEGRVQLASSARSPYPSVVAAIAVAIAEAAASGSF